MHRLPLVLTLLLFTGLAFSQKRPVDQSDYESWKLLKTPIISQDGKWISYEVNPLKGDGQLFIYNTETGARDSVSRGYAAKFSGDSHILAFKVKPEEDTMRKAKLAEVKKDKLPKDSLGIYTPAKKHLAKIARVKSFKLAEEGDDWLAYLLEEPLPVKDTTDSTDTTNVKKKPKQKKAKQKGNELVILKVIEGREFRFDNVTDYEVSRNGERFGFITAVGDSIDSTLVYQFDTEKQKAEKIFENAGVAKQITVDDDGEQISFVYSADTAKAKNYNLAYWAKKSGNAQVIIDSTQQNLPENWRVSEHRKPDFSRDGKKLFFGTAPGVKPEPKDTLLKEEKVQVDIWNWKDPLLQPQQKKQLKKEKKRNYLAAYFLEKDRMIQLADEEVDEVRLYDHGDAGMALGHTIKPYSQLISWEGSYRDYYAIDVTTGARKQLLKKHPSTARLSPSGKYLLWFQNSDSSWYVTNVENEKVVSLSKELPFNFYNELNDIPKLPGNYGIAGWCKDERYVLINDRYDIWKFDQEGKEEPFRITDGYGRENEIRFRYQKLDKESTFVEENMMLTAFDHTNKQGGFFLAGYKQANQPQKLIMDDHRYKEIIKAAKADKFIWNQEAFNQYPDLYWSNLDFESPVKVTDLDKQRDQFLWGDVQLVKWTSSDGEELEGLLYTPENLDQSEKYPLLVYFYERNADNLNGFRHLSPSRSIINPSYCVSNGYVVFVPDIPYLVGYPGESALSAVVSGTLSMCAQFPFIDKENMGIQGQSWGGYQVAYLVTQTNLYKAGMAGAPVSNMTSAYGGIRWGSGMSRMIQYEKTQSRIGGTLWEKPLLYIENSPLFFVDKIETPLLIMHNDNDGAVPWYQGIEMFVAMRRLQKPAWMLTYNNEEHNLTKWPNRMDLDKRMYQFFDHYLKGAPEPVWMKTGVPAIEKGKNPGYELTK